ncbi:MAG: ribonuclease HII [Clostridia bacterium]
MTENERLKLMTDIEREYWNLGLAVAGTDEAGRGPLAGPVAAACVIMPDYPLLEFVNDSKKLSEKKREILYNKIKETAIAYGVAFIDNETIDRINILNATKLAFKNAYLKMLKTPDVLLVDAVKNLDIDVLQRPIIHGDAISYSIAAASILAKVERDRLMVEFDKQYPDYNFKKHKGYGTREHRAAIIKFGLCPIHRRTFLKKTLETAKELGDNGELIAEKYLNALGYRTLEKNYRADSKEIDLIMLDNDTVVFAEVKARSSGLYGAGRDAVTAKKKENLTIAADFYARANNLMDSKMRFDVIEVDLKTFSVSHIKSAFLALYR